MNKKITKFEDLRVWKLGHDLTLEIYRITRDFPKDEVYGIVSQLRRASSSVCANIVEGFYRDTTKELIKFLYNARGSAGEVTYFLILVKDLGFVDKAKYEELRNSYENLLKSISALINSLKRK